MSDGAEAERDYDGRKSVAFMFISNVGSLNQDLCISTISVLMLLQVTATTLAKPLTLLGMYVYEYHHFILGTCSTIQTACRPPSKVTKHHYTWGAVPGFSNS